MSTIVGKPCSDCGSPVIASTNCTNNKCKTHTAKASAEFDRAIETPSRIAAVELCLKLGYVWRDGQWIKRDGIAQQSFRCGRCSSLLATRVNENGIHVYVCPNGACILHNCPRTVGPL